MRIREFRNINFIDLLKWAETYMARLCILNHYKGAFRLCAETLVRDIIWCALVALSRNLEHHVHREKTVCADGWFISLAIHFPSVIQFLFLFLFPLATHLQALRLHKKNRKTRSNHEPNLKDRFRINWFSYNIIFLR